MNIIGDKQYLSKRSKRFYNYFFSYMILLLLSLLLLVAVVYVNFIETMIHDAEASNISSLQQIKSMTDIRHHFGKFLIRLAMLMNQTL